VSLHRSTTYFTALTLFDTGAYKSCVNREVAEWLEQQLAMKNDTGPSGDKQRLRKLRDTPTATIGLAGTNHTASVYGTIVFDLTFLMKLQCQMTYLLT